MEESGGKWGIFDYEDYLKIVGVYQVSDTPDMSISPYPAYQEDLLDSLI